ELPGRQAPWSNPAKEIRQLLHILRVVLPILLVVWMFRQVRKPSGRLGGRVVRAMNLSHATLADWGLQQVTVSKTASALDIGCGGGWMVRRVAALACEGWVVGLDDSAASLGVSRDTNAKEIEAGRVQIEHARRISERRGAQGPP